MQNREVQIISKDVTVCVYVIAILFLGSAYVGAKHLELVKCEVLPK